MNNLLLSLEITALGMGLVFAAIILLWWMMAALTSMMSEKADQDSADSTPLTSRDSKAQAAAIAVAIALAEQKISHAHPLTTPPTAIISAWQLGMRTRQLYQKGTPIARKPRKVG